MGYAAGSAPPRRRFGPRGRQSVASRCRLRHGAGQGLQTSPNRSQSDTGVAIACGARQEAKDSAWYVYMLRCRDGTLYTGIAVDLVRRLEAHRRGTGAKYTRSRLPVKLVYRESQPDRSHALKREIGLRRLGREGKLALIGAR